jgi:DHA2 family multidrug resistance protein
MPETSAAPGGSGGHEWTPERSVAGNRNPWSIVAVISIATFMTVLDTSIVNVALDHIAGGLAVSYDEATWVTTSFLIATAIVIPISGWLANVIGRKRYYMISVAMFTVSSLLCGLAPNLTPLILARVLQGAAGGGLAAVEQSMLVDTFPPAKRGLAFAA